jgi:hypothetical protein
MPGMHAPHELETDPTATHVSPRLLEVYFDNTCNLKCVYCGPFFSTSWNAENTKFGTIKLHGQTAFEKFNKSPNLEANKVRLFNWLKINGQYLTNFNILGGEPLFQKELDQCIELFREYPAPDLDLQIFSNLNVDTRRVVGVIEKMRDMVKSGCIKNFTVTASLDCWGPAQEYARYPLDLELWERNFNLLLAEPWIKIIIGSTITPLTVHTLPDLIERINQWNQTRPVYHYFNSVNSPEYMFIDIFGDFFREDFDRCLELFDPSRVEVKKYLQGIADQSCSTGINTVQITNLKTVLDELDRRRNTNWRQIFPWLTEIIDQNQL